MSELDLKDRIKNRNNWLRLTVTVAIAALTIWKLATAQITFANLRATDLLAFLLSLFAIGLAVAFYFKATDTSNLFYDNTYKFTKDISEILGRIEAGFGERLRHLDEGYSGLRDTFAKLPLDTTATNQALKEEEATAKKLEKERNDILAQLVDKAKLQEQERKEFFSKLTQKEQEVRQARADVMSLRGQLEGATEAGSRQKRDPILRRMESYVTMSSQRARLHPVNQPLSLRGVRDQFRKVLTELNEDFVEDMRRMGFLDSSSQLTFTGARWLRGLLLHGAHGA